MERKGVMPYRRALVRSNSHTIKEPGDRSRSHLVDFGTPANRNSADLDNSSYVTFDFTDDDRCRMEIDKCYQEMANTLETWNDAVFLHMAPLMSFAESFGATRLMYIFVLNMFVFLRL